MNLVPSGKLTPAQSSLRARVCVCMCVCVCGGGGGGVINYDRD